MKHGGTHMVSKAERDKMMKRSKPRRTSKKAKKRDKKRPY